MSRPKLELVGLKKEYDNGSVVAVDEIDLSIQAGETVALLLERDNAEFEVEVTLARSAEIGELPDLEEPFDPSSPIPDPDEE